MDGNFAFMEQKYPVLAGFGNLAERYWHSDPNSCIVKIGMMGETIVNLIYEIDRIPRPKDDRADERIKKLLYEEYITADLSDILHELRKKRNHATHENYGRKEIRSGCFLWHTDLPKGRLRPFPWSYLSRHG